MAMFTRQVITTRTEIAASPQRIWDFFLHLEDNYVQWHPDHVFWRWKKGGPLRVGSRIDSAETVGGHKGGIKATVIESVENSQVTLKPAWPISFMCPRIEWTIQGRGDGAVFIARTHYKFGRIFSALQKDAVRQIVELTQRHMDEEGQNLKAILEGR